MRMLSQNLPDEVCKKTANVHIVKRTSIEYRIVWNHPKEAEFSVKSTYKALSTNEQLKPEKLWKFIGRWPGNQQTRTFMWLCAHDILLRNKQRSRRNPIVDPLCAIYNSSKEIHALRDYPANKDVWKMLIHAKYWPAFFSGNIIDWILFNNKREIVKLNNTNWKQAFGETIRKI